MERPADPVTAAPSAIDRHPTGLVAALASLPSLLVAALRLFVRHWPTLFLIFFIGVVARELVMRLAVWLSLINAELGLLVLVLAPMTTLTALVLMLRTVRPSLPFLGTDPHRRPPSVLNHLGSVLVPFMAIYYFEDYLREDIVDYHSRVLHDSITRNFASVGTAAGDLVDPLTRMTGELSPSLAGVVIVAIVARWLLSRWSLTQRHQWLGIPGAYLELVWVTLVSVVGLNALLERVTPWLAQRRVVSTAHDFWSDLGHRLQELLASYPVLHWFTRISFHLDTGIIIPVAWLAIGAIVLGHQAPPAVAPRLAQQQLYQRLTRRWWASPQTVRWSLDKLTTDLRERFTPLLTGARMLLRGGIAPMLVFCVAFVAAQATEDWLWELQRAIIGPRPFSTVWYPLSWPLQECNRAVSYVLLVCLLAPAIDRAVMRDQARVDSATSNRT